MANLLSLLKERTLIKESTFSEIPNKKLVIFCGFDPTAPSLHIGSLMPLMCLRLAKQCGHETIGLIGGATALIGDPTWKSETRKMLSAEFVETNSKRIGEQLQRIGNIDHLVNNKDWLNMDLSSFLRDIASHFSVNQLLNMDTFQTRIESQQHLSFMEFTYPLMQGYDFLYLFKKYGCNVQIGGSDQFGNICQGISFIKKMTKEPDIHGMTMELLVTSAGQKMGKTVDGAVFLDKDMFSVYKFWQYFRNIDDADVENLLLKFTLINRNRIQQMVQEDIISAKKTLADEVTTLVHGEREAKEAREQSEMAFEAGNFDRVESIDLGQGPITIDLVTVRCGFADSKSEAKRLIRAGSLVVDGSKITDHNYVLEPGEHLIRFAKKNFMKVVVS